MILLTACTSGSASGTVAASPISGALVKRVLGSARVILVTYAPAPAGPPPAGAQSARTESVTVTSLDRVRRVAGLIDGLSLASPGEEWSCPAFTGGVVNLASAS